MKPQSQGWSGKADRVYLLQKNKDKIALIVDFKSSRYTTRAQEMFTTCCSFIAC